MKMKRGEVRNLGDGLEGERLCEVLENVVDDSVHPLDVVEGGVISAA